MTRDPPQSRRPVTNAIVSGGAIRLTRNRISCFCKERRQSDPPSRTDWPLTCQRTRPDPNSAPGLTADRRERSCSCRNIRGGPKENRSGRRSLPPANLGVVRRSQWRPLVRNPGRRCHNPGVVPEQPDSTPRRFRPRFLSIRTDPHTTAAAWPRMGVFSSREA